MGYRIKRVPRRAKALPAGTPYRDAGGYPLEARRDELHVFVKRRSAPPLIVAVVAVLGTLIAIPPAWVWGVTGAVVLWMIALATFGQHRFQVTGDGVALRTARVWAPPLVPRLRGALAAVRVQIEFRRRKGETYERPFQHTVVVRTTRGERTIARFEQPADAHALAAAIDEHFGLVPPAEPLGAPALDEPPAR